MLLGVLAIGDKGDDEETDFEEHEREPDGQLGGARKIKDEVIFDDVTGLTYKES